MKEGTLERMRAQRLTPGLPVSGLTRKDGKTKCENTFSGYECVCGPGFIQHVDEAGRTKCLNINECVSTEAADLDPKCTCERCACQDTYGGYKCARPRLLSCLPRV